MAVFNNKMADLTYGCKSFSQKLSNLNKKWELLTSSLSAFYWPPWYPPSHSKSWKVKRWPQMHFPCNSLSFRCQRLNGQCWMFISGCLMYWVNLQWRLSCWLTASEFQHAPFFPITLFSLQEFWHDIKPVITANVYWVFTMRQVLGWLTHVTSFNDMR